MTSVDVRQQLVHALQLDLIGPRDQLGQRDEILPQRPSSWYLTGFLVPLDAEDAQRTQEPSDEQIDEMCDAGGADDTGTPEPAAARRKYLPSSIGLSVLVSAKTQQLNVTVRWGDYLQTKAGDGQNGSVEWQRSPNERRFVLNVPERTEQPVEQDVPESRGLRVALSVRPVQTGGGEGELPTGTRSVSVFLVNRRRPAPDETRDEAFAFQVELQVECGEGFIARPNVRNLTSDDWDERVADLQYHDAYEHAVGHSVATEAAVYTDGRCVSVRTCWIPQAEVERVAPAMIPGVELGMDVLGQLKSGADAASKLGNFVTEYRAWIEHQRQEVPASPRRRQETAEELLSRAAIAAKRIEAGIKLLDDPQVLEAFRLTNQAMSMAAKQRNGVMMGKDPAAIQPAWRPFQIAFLLMNMKGVADPTHPDRGVVDLLFFPTGGGKTEAYLGLAAFTLVLRRLRNPGVTGAGLSVLMRYTLRLLTLDQLSRAATLICALELLRQNHADKLGDWPFEIGLWVGKAATPNRMGAKGDGDSESARAKTIAFKNDDRRPAPIPLEECPWCGAEFRAESFQLLPGPEFPKDLRVNCVNRRCEFSRGQSLPILGVDEPIYRRLPCFMIATVDKFAAMPWTGEVGALFGRVQRYDKSGFYGPCHPLVGQTLPGGQLLPPDLVIQDELHLISGPLGTLVGLYETALDELCTIKRDSKRIPPKIVASTATVRRAESQIRALFNRHLVDIFPAPGPNRRNSFFAEVHAASNSNARLYVGVAAQGRSPKVVMLRVYLALLAAAQKAYSEARKHGAPQNPADPYMTLLGYFNSLRELGGARRVVEDEVSTRVSGYANRRRVGESEGLFGSRKIAYDVVELTSRISTDKVAEAKQRLSLAFSDKAHVDVAIATNMISVGLDIVRLGLMVVFGQPKSSAEYIQATSRVGRDASRPGLIVTILNIHKPRDRSHYERFPAYHQTFYRSVEATSVTPFSPRALDRGLAGTLVALARQGHQQMTPPKGATAILTERAHLDFVVEAITERATTHANLPTQELDRLRQRVRERVLDLFDEWSKIAMEYQRAGVELQYQEREVGAARPLLYQFLDPELKRLPPRHRKFRANRSMRDVEPSVNLWLRTIDGIEVVEDDQ